MCRLADLLRLGPWSFIVHIASPRSGKGGPTSIATSNDDARASRTYFRVSFPSAQVNEILPLQNAGAIASAPSEKLMAENCYVILRGTGFPRGAVVRPLEAAGEAQVIVLLIHRADCYSWICTFKIFAQSRERWSRCPT